MRVYQAYSDEIADTALVRGTFISPPFQMDRIRKITDITDVAHAICDLVKRNELDQARAGLPVERPYDSVFG